jgi:hypothetical protein
MSAVEENLVFLSYARPDRDRVIQYFDRLSSSGFNAWMDCRKLKAGQRWSYEIERAAAKAVVVIVFISANSVERRGYVQKELKEALERRKSKLVDDIFLMPVILDDTGVPPELEEVHCVWERDGAAYSEIEDALMHQFGRLNLQVLKIQRNEEISWNFETIEESMEGLPGYDVNLQIIKLHSTKFPKIGEVNSFIKGQMMKDLFIGRSGLMDQEPGRFNFGSEKFSRTNSIEAHCTEPSIKGRVLTVMVVSHWYYAGAAHPGHSFSSYSFLLDPLFLIESLGTIFIRPDSALTQVQSLVRSRLKALVYSEGDQTTNLLSASHVDSGTQKWSDFGNFKFLNDRIEFDFSPYQVGPYAAGPQDSFVLYEEIISMVRPEFISALSLEYVRAGSGGLINEKLK